LFAVRHRQGIAFDGTGGQVGSKRLQQFQFSARGGGTRFHAQNRIAEIGRDARHDARIQGLVREFEVEGQDQRLPHAPVGEQRTAGVEGEPLDPRGAAMRNLGLDHVTGLHDTFASR